MNEINITFTQKYDIGDLTNYFTGENVNGFFATPSKNLHYYEVNQHFPIEITRKEGYSLYSVNQGGYFYVFWSKMHISSEVLENDNPFVYFTSYLPSTKNISLFDCLMPGISTSEDVKAIDPYFELSFLMSNGIFSYSFLDDENLLEIEYTRQENIDGYEDLIVKEKRIVPRSSAQSRYSTILNTDLPC